MNIQIAALLTALLPAVAMAQDNSDCWKEGWQKGWCDAKGQNTYCTAPYPPYPPYPPYGRDDCQSRFADGYREGIKAGD